jgi:two-component system nitrogen regulation response regulator GlnG
MQTTIDGSTHSELTSPEQLGISYTILWHPVASRIGAQTFVPFHRSGDTIDLSRTTPVFDDGQPLDDPHVSRTPLQFVAEPSGGVHVWPGRSGLRYLIDGRQGVGGEPIPPERLHQGVVLTLGRGPMILVERGWTLRAGQRCGLVGCSRGLELLRLGIIEAAARDSSVLVLGASGTGKELVARALHQASTRASGPFVAINLAALPGSVATSQLFGHTRGSFTGAERASPGFFGQAEGGTLLLDEVGACPTEVQALLLRALESHEIQPVGGAVKKADVRVVASTDEDLHQAMRDGRFRAPLYYRLGRVVLTIPPLATRPADIATQAVHFLRESLVELGEEELLEPRIGKRPWLSQAVMQTLLGWSWPGNTRELCAVVERMAYSFCEAEQCQPPSLKAPAAPGSGDSVTTDPGVDQQDWVGGVETWDEAGAPSADKVQRELAAHGYNIRATAAALGVGINTVRRRMEVLDLPRPRDLDASMIREALRREREIEAAAAALKVSPHGLKLRMSQLGIELQG